MSEIGERGPHPERRDNLLGHRTKEFLAGEDVSRAPGREVRWYHPDPEWHPIAIQLYRAARKSGQAIYYQQSDIALLYSLCDDLSDLKHQGRRSAQMAATVYSALTGLLLSEGDRRRVRIELDTVREEDEAKKAADEFYESLGITQQ